MLGFTDVANHSGDPDDHCRDQNYEPDDDDHDNPYYVDFVLQLRYSRRQKSQTRHIEKFEPGESVYAESMTYTITLPNVTRESASAIEANLRGVNGIDSVDIDVPSERAIVNSTLTYGEVLDAIRQTGVAAS
ncbi:heavy-metal-associated domain-containing protein [Nocardia sp. NBC_01730]|uniref:heavy-metal-associated domain-containing protein n=1 Tax=Nocardia sp. NBC_01730 TaxID=2975998 RepID=UPI002E0E5BAE|nr:heavy-metal-associated domain-containing protein [Nocardia sp. NBC_01730]